VAFADPSVEPTARNGRTAVLVPAAGRGERLGPGAPKALRPLGGIPMLVHAVRALAASRTVDIVVIAAPEDTAEAVASMLAEQSFPAEVLVVTGVDTRQDSVARALLALPSDIDVVLVHDAARPLVPVEVVTAVVAAVRAGYEAVVPGLPVVDTIKQVDAESDVVRTVDRTSLRAIQTPQGFRRSVLQQAHAAADLDQVPATDDAGLVELLGRVVHVIPGHEEAFKVTTPLDIVMAEAVLARRRAAGAV
jgi:2-C-methyl-D-erythritol 4-phosphate cytidylyltransferase